MKIGSILLTSVVLMAGAWFVACSSSDDAGSDQHAAGETKGEAVLPFIADDYDAALASARERNLPIFVDTWAPW